MVEVTIVVLVDADGNQACGIDLDAAQEVWDNDIGGCWHRRIDVALSVDMTPTLVKATVPAATEPAVIVQ